MRSAVIDSITNVVVNIIIADPAKDPAPDGCYLVLIPDDVPVDMGWMYDPTLQYFYQP